MTTTDPTPSRRIIQFPLWFLLFVLPTIAALVSGYSLLSEHLEHEIVVQLELEKEKQDLRDQETWRRQALQAMSQAMERDRHIVQSVEDVWIETLPTRRPYFLSLGGPVEPLTSMPHLRLFNLTASDEQLCQLIRLAEKEAWNGYNGRAAIEFLIEAPEIFPARLDAIEPELIRVWSSLAESDQKELSDTAKGVLQKIAPDAGQIAEQEGSDGE